MKADWIEIKRGDIMPQFAGIHVSINPKGFITMNRATHQMLGEPAAFLLLYDRVNNRIGLKPSAKAARNAYPILRRNRTGAMIHAYRLLREHPIILPHTLEFDTAEIDDDGILVLDLRLGKLSQRSIACIERHKRNKAAHLEPER
jgi:hypothetical protein